MKNLQIITVLIFSISLHSCYFGAGLVEESLTENIELMAINSLDEAKIIYQEKGSSVYYTLVSPAVFSVGHDNNFIIAKSHPVNSKGINTALTFYHIIEVSKVSIDNHEESLRLTFKEFQSKWKQLNMPDDLKFTIDL
jgi:hypothetical protein